MAAIAVLLPLFVWGPTRGHDFNIHMQWSAHFTRSLRAGCWYPRWLAAVNDGFGSPTFVFYPPGFHYAAAAARLAGLPPVAALLAISALALWLSAMTMVFFLRSSCGAGAAILGAAAYIWLPYRLLDFYERAALPESAAFIWPPLLLVGIDRSGGRRATLWLAATAFAAAALVFTHHGMAALFLPLAIAYAVCGERRGWAGWSLAALILGVGVAAISLLPAIAERPYVHWMSPHFRSGFLFSDARTLFPWLADRLDGDGVSYVALAAFSVAAAVRLRRPATWLFTSGILLPVFLASAWSAGLWATVPGLQLIDLPWRWLAVATFCGAAMLAAGAGAGGRWRRAALLLALLAAGTGTRNWVIPARYDASLLAARSGYTGWADLPAFRPRWAPLGPLPRRLGAHVTGGRAHLAAEFCDRFLYDAVAPREANMEVDIFYYPSWQATAGGAAIRVWPHLRTGLIQLRLPKGKHRVVLQFGRSPQRLAGAMVSLFSLLGLAAMVAWRRRHDRTAP